MIEDIAYLNAPGVDVAVTTSSQVVTLPMQSNFIIVKNVGTGEAFVKGLNGTTGTVTASAASGMSFPPGAIETYRSYSLGSSPIPINNIAVIGAAATTLRVYCVTGI
jgi:hypothetical protein